MNKNPQNRGITLIALVITIIILLILAGVSIAMISGNNGILSKTGETIVKQQLGTAQDKCVLIASDKLAEYYYDTYVNVSADKDGEYNNTKLDNIIVEAIIKDEKNVKELKDLGVTTKGNEEETDGSRTKFTLTYTDGSKINGTVDNGKIIWDGYVYAGNSGGDKPGGEGPDIGNIEDPGDPPAPAGPTKTIASINIEEMTLDGASLITATLEDGTIATSEDVKWSSNNRSVATVTKNGIVICGKNTGTAKITCTGNGVSKTCTVTSLANKVYKNDTTANRTIIGSTAEYGYNQPIIPVGFTAINTEDAKWKTSETQTDYNKGLVIMDDNGNQFVWVPIDGTSVHYTKWFVSGISPSGCSDDTLPTTDKATTYGGFWIGRYETGIDVDMGTAMQTIANEANRNKTGTPIIVEGASPWNYINYTNSQINANDMYKTSYVQSGLVNGTQWDTTMKWIQNVGSKNVESDSTNWGNHYNVSLTLDRYKMLSLNNGGSWENSDSTSESVSQLLRTGSSTTTKGINISDLAGNLWEWTNEISNQYRVFRGSYFNGPGNAAPAAYRNCFKVTHTDMVGRFPCSTLC